jgi:UDP-N-acetylglucosamine 2-epimerase (non-hydrolysing)
MSDVFFQDLDIPAPTWSLGVGSGTHAVQTAAAMVKLEELFSSERPDVVFVVGDVNSTLAGALAAAKLGIRVVHLEAGLRSRDMSMPEEVNRLVTDQLSAMLLTTVQEARDNLISEGVDPRRIHFTGNIMAESVLRNLSRAAERDTPLPVELGVEYLLATIHRPENTDHPERLAEIAAALENSPLPVVLPAHPRTRNALAAHGVGGQGSNVRLTEPVGYLDMLRLQQAATVVVTDSGGVQEEACMVGTPCVTVRRNTERGITVEVGANRLAPAERSAILSGIDQALDAPLGWRTPELWDDKVSSRVVAALRSDVIPLAGQE